MNNKTRLTLAISKIAENKSLTFRKITAMTYKNRYMNQSFIKEYCFFLKVML